MPDPSSTTAVNQLQPRRRHGLEILLVTALLLIHFTLAVSSVRHKSNTFDEYIHLTAGYSYWAENDYRLQPENGNFPQRWAALPLLFSNLAFPGSDTHLWKTPNVWEIGYQFFYALGNNPDTMLLQGRTMICLLSVALAPVVFFWSRTAFGKIGGYLSLGLYVLSPNIIAHSRLTTSDMASALFFILSLKLLWDLLHKVAWQRIVFSGMAVAGLLLSKMSGVLIVPMLPLLIAFRLLGNKPLVVIRGPEKVYHGRLQIFAVITTTLVVVAVISTIVVWGAYGFRFKASVQPTDDPVLSFPRWSTEIEKAGRPGQVIEIFRDNKVLPEAYLYGLAFVISHAKKRAAFLAGDSSLTGWWYFFIYSYFIKTPLASILLLCLGLLALVWRKDGDIWYRLVPLVVLVIVYGTVALNSSINIGHRHILVIYPTLFIVSGGLSLWLLRYRTLCKPILLAAFSVYVFEGSVIWPDYLAYFNAAVGGPQQGYRYLVDSSLDWGQDLPALSRWLQENQPKDDRRQVPVYLNYFGSASPKHYNIDARMVVFRRFPWHREPHTEATEFSPGIYCISATSLQQVYGRYGGDWTTENEDLYWRLLEVNAEYKAGRETPATWDALKEKYGGFAAISRLILAFRELQFARLCHHLKQRQPDDHVGHSILIYVVGPRELQTALHKPMDG